MKQPITTDERQQLQRQILQISEQEKASIGHHLHDSIGQTLTGVTSLMEALESELSGAQRPSASRIRELLQGALQEVRRMSHGLSPLTVKNHVQKILRKLNVVNRAQAVGKALDLRILTP